MTAGQIITERGCSRVGLMGNPGDALGGPAITLAIDNVFAEVTVRPSERLCIEEPADDQPSWYGLEELFDHIQRRGFHGGRRLMMALIRRLARHHAVESIPWPPPNFTLTWRSTIPPCVGLAGSSALLAAGARAIARFWGIRVSASELVRLMIRTEVKDLGIPAGPQDRVAQVHQGLMFLRQPDPESLEVERLNIDALPPLFVAYDPEAGEGTEVFHSTLRGRFMEGDPVAREGVQRLGELVETARGLLTEGRGDGIGPLMDENFEIRRRLSQLNPRHVEMIEIARLAGAHAKYAGSGGAIVGTCAEEKIDAVIATLEHSGLVAFRPSIAPPKEMSA